MSKLARSEGVRVATAIKANKAKYYIADVQLEDDEENVKETAKVVRKTLGKVEASFMLISAGVSKLIVLVDSPDALSAKEWLEHSVSSPVEGGDDFAFSSSQMEMPFKQKDIVRSLGFAYLRQLGLLEEEESEEEYFDF